MNIEDVKTLDDWKAAMGTGFRLTKDEKARGIDREVALVERIATFQGIDDKTPTKSTQVVAKSTVKASKSRKGDILIRIRPEAGVPTEYFEHLAGKQIEVVLDEKWYGWLDNKLDVPYNGDIGRLMKHMLDLGIGEVITTINFEHDLEKHEDIFRTD